RGLVGGRDPGDARAGAARPAPDRAVPRHAQTREHRHRLRGRSRRSPLRRPSAGGRAGFAEIEARSADLPLVAVGVDQARFREKVTAFIREHRDHVAIQRLRRNLPLTETDIAELERILVEQGDGTPETLEAVSGERGLGIFVRSLVGLDRGAAEAAFAEKIAFGGLNATQMEFLTMVIDELTRRGEMRPERLFQSPYEDRAATRIDIVFPDE